MSDLEYEAIKIRSISHYLNILTKKYPNSNENNERFYRGLSNQEYIDVDYPSIYRAREEKQKTYKIKYDPYINYEDKIFHDIISRSPEQFKHCNNTFESLVVMQHYGTPTRLLDVTTNPLVALYFACVNGDGSISSNKDGSIAIYDIPQSNIKNFNSDTVTILSNLARINEEYTPFNSMFNQFIRDTNKLLNNGIKFNHYNFVDKIFTNFSLIFDTYSKIRSFIMIDSGFDSLIFLIEKNKNIYYEYYDKYKSIQNNRRSSKKENAQDNGSTIDFHIQTKDENELYEVMERSFNGCMDLIKSTAQIISNKIDKKFKHLILEEKSYFIHENIDSEHLKSIFCVKPKLNNPRIINQNGAFLIFGFASLTDSKLAIPIQHFQFRPKNNEDGKFLKIIITKGRKNKIVNELKLLGIDRAFIYPEIESVSKAITDKYTKNPRIIK